MRTFITLLVISFFSCNHPYKTDDTTKEDSSNLEVINDDDELKNIVNGFQQLYPNPVKIDTSFTWGADSFQLLFKHYSLMDSSIVLPEKYVRVYGMKKFTAHPFVSDIHFYKNGVEILNTKINKDDFKQYLDSSLSKYAVLLYPSVEIFSDSLSINYSISIPLTDVGKSARATIDSKGVLEMGVDINN